MAGTQGSSYSSPSAAATANRNITSNVRAGLNPSGSSRTAYNYGGGSGGGSVNAAAAAAAARAAAASRSMAGSNSGGFGGGNNSPMGAAMGAFGGGGGRISDSSGISAADRSFLGTNAASPMGAAMGGFGSSSFGGQQSPISNSRNMGGQQTPTGAPMGTAMGGFGAPQSNNIAAIAKPPTSIPGSYAGPKGALSLTPAARYASVGGVGAMPSVNTSPSDIDTMARLMLAESSIIKNPQGGIATPGLLGVAEVIRNRMLSDQFPDTLSGVMNQPRQFTPMQDGSISHYTPQSQGYQAAYDVARAVLSGEQAPTVGNSLNYANIDYINQPGSGASQRTLNAFNSMRPEMTIASASNPSAQHTFGTIGNNSDVSFNLGQPQTGGTQIASAAAPAAVQPAGAQPSIWERIRSGAMTGLQTASDATTQIKQGLDQVPGTPEQQAQSIKDWANGNYVGAGAGYVSGLLGEATKPIADQLNKVDKYFGGDGSGGTAVNAGIGTPDRKNLAAEKNPNETRGLAKNEEFRALSKEDQSKVRQLVKNGMSLADAIKKVKGGTTGGNGSGTGGPTQIAYPTYYTNWMAMPKGPYA